MVQTFGSMPMNKVETFKSSVKSIKDTTRLAVITYGRQASFLSPIRLPPRTIGNSGSTHGASAVSSPAMYESTIVMSIKEIF